MASSHPTTPPMASPHPTTPPMKIAIMAPLVTSIREPQRGGSQAFVSDLARGLAGRGHDVHVYAASGSQIPGVEVIDTGVDPGSLAGTLYRAFGPATGEPGKAGPATAGAAESAFTSAYTTMALTSYDVIHNHAFDAPAVRLATALDAPVVHTLHLPPDKAVSAALRQAARGGGPPAVATVSEFQARAWRQVVSVDAILPPYPPTGVIAWTGAAGRGALFAGRLSPEKGAAEAIDIARAAGMPIDVYGDVYDAGVHPGADRPAAALARGDCARGGAPDLAVGGYGAGGGRALPRPLGRAVRDGRRRGAGVRDSRGRVPARRAR